MIPIPHLHVHSTYTLLGSTASVDALIERAVADGHTHLALSDTNALYGAVTFASACHAADIQPIIGMTVTLATNLPDQPRDQLVLLATGPTGYRSLCRLTSQIQGSPQREQLAARGFDWQTLADNNEGLLCIGGGRQSSLTHALATDDHSGVTIYIDKLQQTYADQSYLALERHTPADLPMARAIEALGQQHGIATVAVQPIYTMQRSKRHALQLLAAIDRNCPLVDVPDSALPHGGDPDVDLHWLSPAEMNDRFKHFPAALEHTTEIAAACQPALPDGRPIWPVLKLPKDQSASDVLTRQAEIGWRALFDSNPTVRTRLDRELGTIIEQGYAPLFLLVADIVRYAHAHDVPVSTRGSVANSLVAFCVGITTVDPIEHNLLFERFLNPERADPPDIDLDFCSIRRDQVLNYVRETYGADQVALVATISTMRPKSAIRETAKAYQLGDAELKMLLALLPDSWHPDPRRRVRSDLESILEKLDNVRLRQVITAAYEIVGQPHHLSLHPGGIVITPGPLTDTVPVQWTPKGFLATQFDHSDVERIGLPKIDLLGIRALTVLAGTVELIRQHHQPNFDPTTMPTDDPKTAAIIQVGDTCGVFQCESSGAQRTLRQLKARTIRDLAVANAFFKPGPATGGMANAFVRRYRGEAKTTFLHPSLEPILADTQGVLLFQEQILRVAHEIAGLSWGQADHLRRGMSKFLAREMESMRSQFIDGCQQNTSMSQQQAQTLWDQVRAFAGYGFNQGHATAYADVSYRMAYLRAHWPAEFIAARLANHGGFHTQAIYIAEAKQLGIPVQPPHINHSQRKFTLTYTSAVPEPVEGKDREDFGSEETGFIPDSGPRLWMGLGQVYGLRRTAVAEIIEARAHAPVVDLRDLLQRVSLQPKEITHLIQCGALDGLGTSRADLLDEAKQIERAGGGAQMAFDFGSDVDSAPETNQAPSVQTVETRADHLAWEKKILGLPITHTPLDLVGLPKNIIPLSQLAAAPNQSATIACYRLPGWTGGSNSFFISDGVTYAIARFRDKNTRAPKAWEAKIFRCQWVVDDWGGGSVLVEISLSPVWEKMHSK